MEAFLDDGDQDVNAHRNEDLCLDRVFACSEEGLDPEVLLDPAKEEFDLPAATVELGHGQSRDRMVVGQETQSLASVLIDKMNQAQFVGVISEGVEARKDDGLVAPKPGAFVHWPGIEATITSIAFDPRDEKRRMSRDRIQSGKIEVGPIQDIK